MLTAGFEPALSRPSISRLLPLGYVSIKSVWESNPCNPDLQSSASPLGQPTVCQLALVGPLGLEPRTYPV